MKKTNIKWMCTKSVKTNSVLKTIKERTPFLRAYGAIIHSSQFRRLSHKTQVHINPNLDFVRTRLTHSLEVSQIGNQLARILAEKLKINKYSSYNYEGNFKQDFIDLVTTACISHDIGQAPFGHAGEKKLNSIAKKYGSEFEANKQNLRLLIGSEGRSAYDVPYCLVDAIFKYKCKDQFPKKAGSYTFDKCKIDNILQNTDLTTIRHPALYLMEASDDIGYICGDIEDAIKHKLISKNNLVKLLSSFPIFDENYKRLRNKNWKKIVEENWIKPSQITNYLIKTLIIHCSNIIGDISKNNDSLKNLPVTFNSYLAKKQNKDELQNILYCNSNKSEIGVNIKKLKDTLYKDYILQSPQVIESEYFAEKIIQDLWDALFKLADKEKKDLKYDKLFKMLPDHVQYVILNYLEKNNIIHKDKLAILVCDYISGMTDRYAIYLWEKFNSPIALKLVS